MGKTLIFSDVDYSENAIAKSDILPTITLNNAALKAMVTTETTGKYINDRGIITGNGNGTLSYIMVELGRYKRIVISGYSGTTTGGFFSSINPSSATKISEVTRSSAGNISNLSLDVPAGAKYFAFNLWNSYSNYSLTKYAE